MKQISKNCSIHRIAVLLVGTFFVFIRMEAQWNLWEYGNVINNVIVNGDTGRVFTDSTSTTSINCDYTLWGHPNAIMFAVLLCADSNDEVHVIKTEALGTGNGYPGTKRMMSIQSVNLPVGKNFFVLYSARNYTAVEAETAAVRELRTNWWGLSNFGCAFTITRYEPSLSWIPLYHVPINANNIELGETGILWSVDYGYNAYKQNLENGTILDSIRFNIIPNPSLDEEGRGVAWDGISLWYSEWGLDSIFCIDPTNGNVLKKFKSPGYGPQALAYGDGFLWHTDEYKKQIYKIDTAFGSIVDSFPVPENTGWFIGIAYSNSYLWLANYTTHNIFKISAFDGAKIDSIYFPNGVMGDIACNGNYLYVASDSVYKKYIGTISIANESKNALPSKFHLSQNYPNPFNPSTTIEYQLPKRGDVQVRIYNSTGQIVKTLVNDNQQAGNYSIVWNGKNDNGSTVSSGSYYYQITTNGASEAKKMIMLK